MTVQTPADVQLGMLFQIRPGFCDWHRENRVDSVPPIAEGSIVEAVVGGYETIPGDGGRHFICARVKAVGTNAVGLVPTRFLVRKKVVK